MQEIEGKYTGAKIYSLNIDKEVVEQTLAVCNHPIFKDCKVRIMPDCHKGKGCTIGFSSQMPKGGEVIPNIIGVDQSCGMYVLKLAAIEELQGIKINKDCESRTKKELDIYAKLDKIGSLGGGNHFIELAKSDNNDYIFNNSHWFKKLWK